VNAFASLGAEPSAASAGGLVAKPEERGSGGRAPSDFQDFSIKRKHF